MKKGDCRGLLLLCRLSILLSWCTPCSYALHICFHTNEFNFRGTSVAIYDYAHYNEELLGHNSSFLVPHQKETYDGESLPRFKKRFPIHYYTYTIRGELMKHARALGCDIVYVMKAGLSHHKPAFETAMTCDGPPVSVHGIFSYEPHGAAFAVLSLEQLKTLKPREFPTMSPEQLDRSWVPHIVVKPTLSDEALSEMQSHDYRSKFNISSTALVFCRHGGDSTFDIPYARDAVCELVQAYDPSRVHFVFLGTKRWGGCSAGDHPQVHFIHATYSVLKKEAYFRSCDVMYHARRGGEMFSVAIAEASVRNIPVVTEDVPPHQPVTLAGKSFLYKSKSELLQICKKFIENGVPPGDYNGYGECSPEKVMARFSKVFIEQPLQKRQLGKPGPHECSGLP